MHQCGTLTWQKREPFWRQCKSLPAKYLVKLEYGLWEHAGSFEYSNIATKEVTIKSNVLLLHPSSNYDTRNCFYFSVLYVILAMLFCGPLLYAEIFIEKKNKNTKKKIINWLKVKCACNYKNGWDRASGRMERYCICMLERAKGVWHITWPSHDLYQSDFLFHKQ